MLWLGRPLTPPPTHTRSRAEGGRPGASEGRRCRAAPRALLLGRCRGGQAGLDPARLAAAVFGRLARSPLAPQQGWLSALERPPLAPLWLGQ